jgi:DnaJ-class molecular chaperone
MSGPIKKDCPQCGGTGRDLASMCPKCDGYGWLWFRSLKPKP